MKRLLGCAVALLLVAGGWAHAGQSEEEKIEAVIAAVIEAYRAGDYTTMGTYYAPDVTMVPGDYGPPVAGWALVEKRYRAAHANLTGAEMTRENTRIVRRGKLAWAVYQWRFAGVMGPETFSAEGHTTLILEKRGRRWLIVHNHTSALVPPRPPETPPETQPSS